MTAPAFAPAAPDTRLGSMKGINWPVVCAHHSDVCSKVSMSNTLLRGPNSAAAAAAASAFACMLASNSSSPESSAPTSINRYPNSSIMLRVCNTLSPNDILLAAFSEATKLDISRSLFASAGTRLSVPLNRFFVTGAESGMFVTRPCVACFSSSERFSGDTTPSGRSRALARSRSAAVCSGVFSPAKIPFIKFCSFAAKGKGPSPKRFSSCAGADGRTVGVIGFFSSSSVMGTRIVFSSNRPAMIRITFLDQF